MDVETAIRTRRSIGRLEGDVPPETVRELVELATCAPNHHLTQPWRFTVVAGDERERLGRLWATVAADAQGLEGAAREEAMRRDAAKLMRAPVLVVVSTRTDADPVVAEEDFAATAAAVENLLLAAHARGLGAAWRTGGIAHDPQVKAYLGLDPGDRIVSIVNLGRAATEPVPVRRGDPNAVLRWLSR
jgi:nitroreductase